MPEPSGIEEVILDKNHGWRTSIFQEPNAVKNLENLLASNEDQIVSLSSYHTRKKGIKVHGKTDQSHKLKHTAKHEEKNVSLESENNRFHYAESLSIHPDKSEECYEEDDIDVYGMEKLSNYPRSRGRKKHKPKYRLFEEVIDKSDDSEKLSSSETADGIAEDYIEGDLMDADFLLETHQSPAENIGLAFALEDTPERSDDSFSVESMDSDEETSQEVSEDCSGVIRDEYTDGNNLNLDNLKLNCSSDDSEANMYDLDPQDMILSKLEKVRNMEQVKQKSALLQQKTSTTKKNKSFGMPFKIL